MVDKYVAVGLESLATGETPQDAIRKAHGTRFRKRNYLVFVIPEGVVPESLQQDSSGILSFSVAEGVSRRQFAQLCNTEWEIWKP